MIEFCVQFGIVAAFGWAVWSYLQMRYAFQVRIRNGEPRLRRGKVSAAFLSSLGEQCRNERIHRGWVGDLHRGRQVQLRFSRNIPAPCQQRLRNEWPLLR